LSTAMVVECSCIVAAIGLRVPHHRPAAVIGARLWRRLRLFDASHGTGRDAAHRPPARLPVAIQALQHCKHITLQASPQGEGGQIILHLKARVYSAPADAGDSGRGGGSSAWPGRRSSSSTPSTTRWMLRPKQSIWESGCPSKVPTARAEHRRKPPLRARRVHTKPP
jgi:hypothetical protein